MAAQDGQATSPLERSGALVDTGARQERPAEVAPAETQALVAIGAGQGMSVASTLALVDTAVRAKSKAKDLVKSTEGMEGKGGGHGREMRTCCRQSLARCGPSGDELRWWRVGVRV